MAPNAPAFAQSLCFSQRRCFQEGPEGAPCAKAGAFPESEGKARAGGLSGNGFGLGEVAEHKTSLELQMFKLR